MKLSRILSYVPKTPVVAFFGLAAAVTVTAGSFAAFGPDRPTFTWDGASTPGSDYVTFNSFENNPVWGDERDFARGGVRGRDTVWTDPVENVEAGQTVRVIMYVHNNASTSLNASGEGIARDTTISVNIPEGVVADSHDIRGTISASNAQPTSVFDDVTISGLEGFEIDYVEGSASVVGNNVNSALSDDIISTGVSLGDALDGNMKGCFEYAVYVTFDVTIEEPEEPEFELMKSVRAEGSGPGNWAEGIDVSTGDRVEWELRFANTGNTLLEDVVVLDQLPEGLTVVPGSIRIKNTNYPDGVAISDDAIQNDGRQINVLIDDHAPTGVTYVYFTTTVDNIDECEVTRKIVNKAYATPKDIGTIFSDAHVKVTSEDCEEPREFSYDCTGLEVVVLDESARTVRATASISNSDNVSVVGTEIDFGGGNVSTDNPAEYSYATAGTKTVNATVTFELDNEEKEVKEATCSDTVTFGQVQGETDEPVLPNTGAGSIMFALFGTTSAAAAAYGYIQSRRTA